MRLHLGISGCAFTCTWESILSRVGARRDQARSCTMIGDHLCDLVEIWNGSTTAIEIEIKRPRSKLRPRSRSRSRANTGCYHLSGNENRSELESGRTVEPRFILVATAAQETRTDVNTNQGRQLNFVLYWLLPPLRKREPKLTRIRADGRTLFYMIWPSGFGTA